MLKSTMTLSAILPSSSSAIVPTVCPAATSASAVISPVSASPFRAAGIVANVVPSFFLSTNCAVFSSPATRAVIVIGASTRAVAPGAVR